jgi:cytochrome c556
MEGAMRIMRWIILLACFSSVSGAVEPAEQIEYRKSVMKTLDEGLMAYQTATQLGVPQSEIAQHLRALALTSGQIKKAFEPRIEGGYAKPDVWKKWSEFSKRAESQSSKLMQLSTSAASGSLPGANELKTALGCVGCHEAFRQPAAKSATASRTPATDPIAYRQQLMRVIDAQTSAIGQILSGTIPEDSFAVHLEVVSLTAGLATGAFERGTPGGDTLPRAWQEKTRFLRLMEDFSGNAIKASRIARQDGKDAAAVMVIDALPCRQCHDIYRKK